MQIKQLCGLTFNKWGYISCRLHWVVAVMGGLVAQHPAVLSCLHHKVTVLCLVCAPGLSFPSVAPPSAGCRHWGGQDSFFRLRHQHQVHAVFLLFLSALKVKGKINLHHIVLIFSSSGSAGSMHRLTAWILTCTLTHTSWKWVKFTIHLNICCVHVYLCGDFCG